VKLVLDGSPQGKTAWLSTPYEQPPDGQDSSYAGYAAMSDEQVAGYLRRIHAKHWPLLAHANGDAAAEQLLRVTEQVVAEQGAFDWRPVMIHAQMVRDDQLARMKPLGMIPSFFTTHTFYWGDWHRDSVMGLDRASRISPAASALRRGLHFTIHNDAPVVPPDAMRLLWAAVNRRTRSGDVIGAHERLTPMQAVRALTIEGAYQSFDAARKGSLEVGKFADLVVLSASPLEVAPDAIRNIVVLETIKEGSTVHLRD
jgi:predicted amidohydrolase YtcJ